MKIGVVSGDYLRADKSPDGKDKWGGAGWARYGQYVGPLKDRGFDISVGHLWLRGNSFCVQDVDGVVHYPDVILMQRLMHGGLDQSIRIAQKSGQIIINDIDDWYWGLDPRNAAFYASHPKYNQKENTSFYKQIIAASDYVTVSTPYLAMRVGAFTNKPIVLLPNYVDVGRFSRREVKDTPSPEVGWAGSTDHRSGDLEILTGVLSPLVNSGRIRLVHGGDMISSPSFASKVGVPDELVRKIPRVNAEEYPSLLDFDIGLVPLRDTPFNHAKSDIKGLEYASSGIPFIATGLTSYADLHSEWKGFGFLLAKRSKDWPKLLNMMLDTPFRKEHAIAAYENVQRRDIRFGVDNMVEFLTSL